MITLNPARGGCLRSDDPKSLWTCTSVVVSGSGRVVGFRTTLAGRMPR